MSLPQSLNHSPLALVFLRGGLSDAISLVLGTTTTPSSSPRIISPGLTTAPPYDRAVYQAHKLLCGSVNAYPAAKMGNRSRCMLARSQRLRQSRDLRLLYTEPQLS